MARAFLFAFWAIVCVAVACSGDRSSLAAEGLAKTTEPDGQKAGETGRESRPTEEDIAFFEKRIRPVLVEHCYQCHAADSKTLQGGLRLDHREATRKGGESGPAVVPGKPAESLIVAALKYDGLQMPPKGRLPESVVADFVKWIELGAADPREASSIAKNPAIDYADAAKFWAFQPLGAPRGQALRNSELAGEKPPVVPPGDRPIPNSEVPDPSSKHAAWPKSDLDRFVLAKFEAAGLSPNPPADRRTLIRRVSFDLIGLPPTPEEVAAFLADDSPEAFAKVVDRLLDSPHYGERWGRRWLDVARYGEDQAHTFKARNYPLGYRYRDWVVQALNADMPYDRFLRLQIAADLIEPDHPEHLPALGLFALGPVYYQDNGEMAKALADEHDDRLDTLARGVWGLTLACARCHDHKFDPLTMQDYYGLLGIFASSQYQERPIVGRDVLEKKSAAVAAMDEQQLRINQLLAAESRGVRPSFATDIAKYMAAGWVVRNRLKTNPKDKQVLAAVAKQENVNEFLLQRWSDYLDPSRQANARDAKPWLRPYLDVVKSQDSKKDVSKDPAARDAVRFVAEAFQKEAIAKLDRRDELFARFGENVAFVAEADRAVVPPGVIPLGNLFDDAEGVSLNAALSSDKFLATAHSKALGVRSVGLGWESNEVEIAPGIRFDFDKLGGGPQTHGHVTNDGWDPTGGIRTLGQPFPSKAPRTEQGIGMHANAYVTFDVQAIREAGLLPADQRFVFKVDRAGLNDDVFGSGTPDVHMAVIVSRPHRKENVFDAILGMWVNGQSVNVQENDTTYYVGGLPPAPLKADGKFATFDIPLPADARYVTLVTSGATKGADGNPINSDHAVFSGARLEYTPGSTPGRVGQARFGRRPTASDIQRTGDGGPAREADLAPPTLTPPIAVAEIPGAPSPEEQDRLDAILLSELLYDQGLLALPPAQCEPRLNETARTELATLRKEFDERKKIADAINVPMAHALTEGSGKDHPLYLLGNPAKASDPVPRSIPAIFTRGERVPLGQGTRDKGQGTENSLNDVPPVARPSTLDPRPSSGRRALAEAVTSPDNPLTARVMANRIWAGHFGHGLVRTPSNFGQLGERPTHPELLDWLAMEGLGSRDEGLGKDSESRTAVSAPRPSTLNPRPSWSLKRLHRTILLSATYQQSSAYDAKKAAIDPENRLLWRMNRQRLEVEPWRDAMLAVTGELDRTTGGPSIDLTKSDNRRRTLYAFVSRHQLNDLLRLFDFPDPNITSDRRTVTTVPLQQLFVLNSGFMAERAKALVKRLEADAMKSSEPAGNEAKLRRAFDLLYGRPPTAEELHLGLTFVTSPPQKEDQLTPWEQYALALLGTNEFTFVD